MFAMVFGILFFMIFLVLGAFVGLYVLYSLGLYTLAKNEGLESAWLAWIPVVNRYLIGELTGDETWGMGNSKWVLCLGPFLCALLAPVFIGFILELAYIVYYFMTLYKLYEIYADKNKDLYIITSIIFRFLIPVWMFVIRNNEAKYLPPKRGWYDVYIPAEEDDLPKPDHPVDLSSDSSSDNPVSEPEPVNAQAPEFKEPVEEKAAEAQPDDHSNSSGVDMDALNKSIDDIEQFAQKAHDEAPGKKPIELHLEKGPEVHFPEDSDNGGE